MNARTEKLEKAPKAVRTAALALLDEISAPMTAREIDDALLKYLGGSDRRFAVNVLKHMHIIAILPGPKTVERL
jgi:hypothetical protein